MRLEHFGLYARDPEALAKWYEKSVGLHVIRCLEKEGRPPVYFLAGAGDAEIEILPTEEPRVDRDLTAPGFSHLGFVVEDFDSEQRRLAAEGIPLRGVRETSNGWRIGYFEDPEGNRIEIVHRP
jgi:glyoxylase I family protein